MKLDRGLGFVVLGVWLVAHGLIQIVNLHFNGLPVVMAILAIAAGALILIRR